MDLKTCPHCGGPAYINSRYSHRIDSYFVFVKCDICGATGKAYTTAEDPSLPDWNAQACTDAATAWNLRNGGE